MTRTRHRSCRYARGHVAPLVAHALVLALVTSACLLSAPRLAAGAVSQASHPFPRLAEWWGDLPTTLAAKRDYFAPSDSDASQIRPLRTLNPDIILLASSSAAELDWSDDSKAATFNAQRIGTIPTSWLLLQVGSRLSAGVDGSSKVIYVGDATKFRIGDLVVVDDEKCLVTGISGSGLSVERAKAGSSAVSHAAGTRIAAVVSDWRHAATLDMTDDCPLGRATGEYATPAGRTERAAEWLARRTAGIEASADWDGVLVDVCVPHYANAFRGKIWSFRTIADRQNPDAERDYAAFDDAWQAGIEAYLADVRSQVNGLVMTNGAPPVYSATNGTAFEGFPSATTTQLQWHSTVFGPTTDARGGSYLDWTAKAASPNLTTVFSMGGRTDYRLMRFGLTTALMGDGYYSHRSTDPDEPDDRWYDEYDNAGAGLGYLGKPTGPAVSALPALGTADLLGGYGAFNSQSMLDAWTLYAQQGALMSGAVEGGTARISVVRSDGTIWGAQMYRSRIAVSAGKTYTMTFRARADRPLAIQAVLQQSSSPHSVYAFSDELAVGTEWQTFEVPLTSWATDSSANVILNLGRGVGTIWLDDVRLQEGSRDVYRRDFEGGTALVNATERPVYVDLWGTYRKIRGTQDPAVNDGTLVADVIIPAKDGIVLLRARPGEVAPKTSFVSTSLSKPAARSSVRVRSKLTVTGKVSPKVVPGTVTLVKSRLVRGKWRAAGSVKVRVSKGSYRYTFRPTQRGKWRVVATYGGGKSGYTAYSAAKSRTLNVRVR